MTKLLKKWSFAKHLISTLLLTAALKALSVIVFDHGQASVGIIGGADGPTAVFGTVDFSSFITDNIIIFLVGITILLSYIPIKYIRER